MDAPDVGHLLIPMGKRAERFAFSDGVLVGGLVSVLIYIRHKSNGAAEVQDYSRRRCRDVSSIKNGESSGFYFKF